MKALITGGAGFIGSHLAERLVADGEQVVILDNLSTGSLENIEAVRGCSRLAFVKGDVRDASLIQLLVSQCDTVYHLAAAVGVQLMWSKGWIIHSSMTSSGRWLKNCVMRSIW